MKEKTTVISQEALDAQLQKEDKMDSRSAKAAKYSRRPRIYSLTE